MAATRTIDSDIRPISDLRNKFAEIADYVRGGVLYVTISSAPLRNELMLNRSRLVDRINDFIGKRVIREVVFR